MPYADPNQQREYQRKYHKRTWKVRKERHQAQKRARVQMLRKLIQDSKAGPCADCGNQYPPYVMDFDHRGDKVMNLSDMASSGLSVERIRKEIAKCDLVCANCHRIRTHRD